MLMLPYTFCGGGDKVALRSVPRANFGGIAIRHGLHAGLTALRCRRDSLWGHGLAIELERKRVPKPQSNRYTEPNVSHAFKCRGTQLEQLKYHLFFYESMGIRVYMTQMDRGEPKMRNHATQLINASELRI